MKKILSVLVSICMIFSLVTLSFAGYKESAVLQFDENGKFKMLVLADVQDDYPLESDMISFIQEALDYAQPDLVVFCGDNINGTGTEAYAQLLAPLAEREIPFTLVFGNHDEENAQMPKEDILKEYQKYPGCLAYDADPALHGCATHNLPVLSSDGSAVAFNLWMFDTGDYVRSSSGEWLGYDWVREDQIAWYNSVRDAMTEENGGEVVPAMAFQHIIPQEPVNEIFLPSDIRLGEVTINFADGTQNTVIPDITKYDGIIFEKSCPSYGNDGQWDAMVQGGDVIGLVVGHDHVNNFIVNCDGIDLIQTPGCTFQSYSNGMYQGARVIEIDEKNPADYDSYILTTTELAMENGSSLVDDEGRTEFDLKLNFYFTKVFEIFYEILLSFFTSNVIA